MNVWGHELGGVLDMHFGMTTFGMRCIRNQVKLVVWKLLSPGGTGVKRSGCALPAVCSDFWGEAICIADLIGGMKNGENGAAAPAAWFWFWGFSTSQERRCLPGLLAALHSVSPWQASDFGWRIDMLDFNIFFQVQVKYVEFFFFESIIGSKAGRSWWCYNLTLLDFWTR